MIIKYDTIKENIKIFDEVKKSLPIIKKYIDGEVSISALQTVGLGPFGNFYDYSVNPAKNYLAKPVLDPKPIIMEGITWRKLKAILVENTTIERFKTYIKNRTQKQFNAILNNPDVYDRLLNGRWVRRPSRRRSQGTRGEKISSFTTCQIEIINYVIFNQIDIGVSLLGSNWFVDSKLILDNTLLREMTVTENLLTSFVDVISTSKIDFKKLNLDYITSYISDSIRKLITIENDTSIKCIKDYGTVGSMFLTEGVSYVVSGYHIRSGYLNVLIKDDTGRLNYYPFSYFEDMAYHRGSLLDSLLGD